MVQVMFQISEAYKRLSNLLTNQRTGKCHHLAERMLELGARPLLSSLNTNIVLQQTDGARHSLRLRLIDSAGWHLKK